MYDIIIIGAGPAGLTAAIYGLRANKKVLVLEGKTYGGQIINAHKIDNYPGMPHISGFDYATALYNQTKELGVEIKFEKVFKITKDKKVITANNTYESKSIILATGSANRKLNLTNEEKLTGKGISYCATCDGNFFKGKKVAVVGNGRTAVLDALYLTDIVSKVYMINRAESFNAEEKLLDDLKSKTNIDFVLNTDISELIGEEKLEGIITMDKNGNKRNLSISGLFIAVGQSPQNEIFKDCIKVTDKGYIESEDGVHTSAPGIYVAGDARVKELHQLVTAVSDGAIAASIAIKEMK